MFELKRGPIFANVVLADEINRTTPRTQSALLEAMSEGQVSIDDATHALDDAVHGDRDAEPGRALRHVSAARVADGPLPPAHLARLPAASRRARAAARAAPAAIRSRALEPVVDLATVRALQDGVETIRVDDALLDYAMTIVEETRRHPSIAVGVSTRGALAWYRAAQAAALADGRDFVVPDDVKALAVPCLAHRLVLAQAHDSLGRARTDGERVIAEIVGRVAVPT